MKLSINPTLVGCLFILTITESQGLLFRQKTIQSVSCCRPPQNEYTLDIVKNHRLRGGATDEKEADDLLDIIEDSPVTPILLVIFSSLCIIEFPRHGNAGVTWILFGSMGYFFAWKLYDFSTSNRFNKVMMGGILILTEAIFVSEAVMMYQYDYFRLAKVLALCCFALLHILWARMVFTFEPSIYEFTTPSTPLLTKILNSISKIAGSSRTSEPLESQNSEPLLQNNLPWSNSSGKMFPAMKVGPLERQQPPQPPALPKSNNDQPLSQNNNPGSSSSGNVFQVVETCGISETSETAEQLAPPKPTEPEPPSDRTIDFLGWLEESLNIWASRVRAFRSARDKMSQDKKEL